MTATVSFETIVVDHNTKNVKNMSIDELLVSTFKIYQTINMRMLKSNESKINDAIIEVKLLEKVKPSLKKYISNKDLSVEQIIENIGNEIKEDKEKIKELFQKYRITKLLTFKADFDDLNTKLNVVKDNIKNIDKFVVDQYKKLIGDENEIL